MNKRNIIITVLFLLSGFFMYAQSVQVEASLDTNSIIIGDQRILSLKVTVPKKSTVVFPKYLDTIMKNIEILNISKIDTIPTDQNTTVFNQKYTITSFDSGSYYLKLGPIKINGKDTMWSRPVFLYVNTLKVDTAKGIADIKKPYTIPLEWAEIWLWLRWIILILLGLGVLAIVVYYILSNRNRALFAPIELDPPHIVAFRDLEKLKEEHLYQDEKFKLYYSKLSDIARTYIERRYEFLAMESTSDEILARLKQLESIDSESFEKIRRVLLTADLAKFAKLEPVTDENELNIKRVFDFVDKTKKIETPVAEVKPTEETETKEPFNKI